jgi:hypothetical protein
MDEFDAFLVELNSEADLIDEARTVEPEGDEPTEKYLAEQGDRFTGWHTEDEHNGGPCTCKPCRWSTTTERPF